ncbi:SMP-30/gluconolactonase/LRE family protein [Tomitella fengzijianii]|uniref:SMP-30/gluconolactonase/LRE family protein n=1 Tax=Tomitella fengzijianii TaxID=2597660 RepID=A0A516X6T5_9ACTN|nr:SMP-30/gluconolactonase/LRE family protein [Tomitella fengzijianii]QDQ98788.1 SMP-30/gluconolactonase/LRE family protein [Tomitella fengzijianii]
MSDDDVVQPVEQPDFEVIAEGLRFPEAPRWHDGALWFSDVYAGRVLRVDPASGAAPEAMAELDTAPCGLGFLPDGSLLILSGTDRVVYRREPDGRLAVHADLSELAAWQLNDMCVDAAGRAFVGDYGDDSAPPEPPRPADLIRVDPDGTAAAAAGGMMFANGMVTTGDGATLIVAETRAVPGRLTAFSIGADGVLTGRRTLCEFDGDVMPDGIAIDGADNVWVASPFTQEILRVDAGGTVDRRLAVPHPYAVALRRPDDGAAGAGELFVCSSPDWRPDVTATQRAGRVLRITLG